MKLTFQAWIRIPRCGRCGSEKLSNVSVEIKKKTYLLCEQCFNDYLKIDAMDNDQRVAFIKRKLPTNFWGRVKFCWEHKKVQWHWLRTGRKKRRKK